MNDIEKIHQVLNVATQQLVNVSFATGGAVAGGILLWGLAIKEKEDAKKRKSEYEDRMLEEDMG